MLPWPGEYQKIGVPYWKCSEASEPKIHVHVRKMTDTREHEMLLIMLCSDCKRFN